MEFESGNILERNLTDLEAKNKELQSALDEIQSFKGIIPMCAYCRKVQDEEGDWELLETYVVSHVGAKFSHGVCPECTPKVRHGSRLRGDVE